MKRIIAFLMMLCMFLSFTGCAAHASNETEPMTTAAERAMLDGTAEELLSEIIAENPVEFMGCVTTLDISDTTDNGTWIIKSNTGLDNAELISEAALFGPMMGSMAFSMVMVRVKDPANAQTVAQKMRDGVDMRKWICVEANELMVAGYGDVVMLIMLDNGQGMSAQAFVDAFGTICGGDLDFVIS